jgi:transposase InsO family protein
LIVQSNGKIERWHKSLKSECIRLGTPLSLADLGLLRPAPDEIHD